MACTDAACVRLRVDVGGTAAVQMRDELAPSPTVVSRRGYRTSLHKLPYLGGVQHHAISSFPPKQESSAVSGALALGARFRGHDENIGTSYAYFCNEVLGLYPRRRIIKCRGTPLGMGSQ
jgi:hypothetical protein